MIYMENYIKQRYYLLFIKQDLFGSFCLIKSFGSLTNKRGRIIVQAYDDQQQAQYQLMEIEYKKRQRDYLYADIPNPAQYYKTQINNSKFLTRKSVSTTKQINIDNTLQEVRMFPNQRELF